MSVWNLVTGMAECCTACNGVPFKHHSNNGTWVSNEV